MRTHCLNGQPTTPADMPGLADLIEHLGTPAFPATLFRTMFDWARTNHLTAFAFEPRR
ncbi:hypothetical protein [Bradyrhizobium sp. Cp5.3]|uniref:hypothetical protein n=1 Tax=Bradyrhizobium sp. Cp5.3 TaxID=443598 RepID=UPI00041922E4|nr:hypothetical protein [Bradyrhizobium sp. Cp5.3]